MKFILILFSLFLFSGDDPSLPYDKIIKKDSYLGYRGIPDAHGISHLMKPPVDYKLNSWGYRDKNFNTLSSDDKIMAFGSSYTFGTGIAANKRWSQLLEQFLCPTRVYNISLPGYLIDQSYLLLKQELERFSAYKMIIYQPAQFSDNQLHLSPISWGPKMKKPMLVFKGGDFKIIPADADFTWLINYSGQNQILNFLVNEYNTFMRDYILFKKNNKKSFETAEEIIKKTIELSSSYKIPIKFIVHENEMFQVLSSLGQLPNIIDLRGTLKNYKINKQVGHINEQGNQIIFNKILGHLNLKKPKGLSCKNI